MAKSNNKPAILIWDIESSYIEARVFGVGKQIIPATAVVRDKHLFCVCYQWYGEKKIHSISILDDPKRFAKDHHDDYYVVKEMHKVLLQADAHVAHYGALGNDNAARRRGAAGRKLNVACFVGPQGA